MKNYLLVVRHKDASQNYSETRAQSEATPLQVLVGMIARGVARYNYAKQFKRIEKGMFSGNKRFKLRFECEGEVLLETETDFSVISNPARLLKFEAMLGAALAYRHTFMGDDGMAAKVDATAFPLAELRQRIEYRQAPAVPAAPAPALLSE